MATISYDTIELKLGSTFNKKGVTNAIANLETLKGLFPMSGVKETANDMKEFANAINSIKSDTIKALANLKGNLSKAVKTLQNKNKPIDIPARISVDEQGGQWKSVAELAHEAVERYNKILEGTGSENWEGRDTTWSGIPASVTKEAEALRQATEGVYENEKKAYDELLAYLQLYPKTKDRYLQGELGFDKTTIDRVRQDMYMMAEDNKRIAEAEKEKARQIKEYERGVKSAMKAQEDALKEQQKMQRELDKAMENAPQSADAVAQIVKQAKRATKEFNLLGKLASRLKNLLVYRALRAVISGIATAIKEGFKNLEDWDRNIGMTGFAESMDRARESLLVLKNSLAVVGAPFLEYLIGILQKVAQLAMAAANAISRFFAILGGKQTYRAVIWADTIAESEKKAGSSAKKATEEFKKQLLAFDEINNITAQTPSGSGGGGSSGGGGGYTDMFEERAVGEVSEVESKLKAIWDWIRKCAEGLKEALSPLLKIKDTIARVVTNTGEFLGKLSVLKKPLDTIWQGVLNVVNAVAGFASAVVDLVGEMIIMFEDTLGIVIEIGDELELWQKMADDAKWKLDLVADVFNSLKVATQQLTAIVEFLGTTMGNLWEVIKGKQSLTEFKQNTADAFQTMQTKIQEASDSFESKIGGAFNKRRAINFDTNGSVTPVEKAVEAAKRALNSLNGYKPHISIDVTENVTRYVKEFTYKTGKFAEGGYPETGQMFVAREAGPELVGTIGGQSAVVNNSDIVASVSQGVAQAVASVLGGGQQVNVTLEGDAKNLFKVVQREGRAYSARTGQPALA